MYYDVICYHKLFKLKLNWPCCCFFVVFVMLDFEDLCGDGASFPRGHAVVVVVVDAVVDVDVVVVVVVVLLFLILLLLFLMFILLFL